MTDPVFLFGSFTEDEANSFRSSPLESPIGKKIQSPPKAVKENGFLPSKPEASAAKQNGHSAAANAVNDSTCRVTANGQAAEIAVDALGQTLGQSPKKRPARPGIAVPVGGGPTAVKHSGGGVNNSVKHIAPKTSKPSSTGQNGGLQNSVKHIAPKTSKPSSTGQNGGLQNSVKVPGGASKKSSNYTGSPPPKAVVPLQNGGVQTSVKVSGGAVHRSVNRTVSPPPNAPVPEENGAGQSSVQASGGAVNDSVNHSTAPTTKVVVPADNGDQADWFVIDTLDVSGSKDVVDNGEESPSKLGNNNVVKGDPEEHTQVVVSARVESEGVLENDGTGASAEDETEAVPSKLLPKSWAALVGVPGESKPGPKQVAGVKGKGRGPAGQVGSNKPQLVEAVVVPCTALAGETWLTSLREAQISGRRLQPRGLVNTGNSCFLNSTVQAMLSCSAFTHLLQVLTARSVPQTGYPTLRAFVDFSGEFESSSIRNLTKTRREDSKVPSVIDVGKPFAPAMFDTVLQSFTPDQPPRGTGHHRQEDAQEFLSFVIDRMHEEILRLQGKDSPSVQSVSSVTSIEDDDWEMVGPKNRSAVTRTHMFSESAITDIFGGQLRSVVKTKGNKASATVQPFLVLHLDIVPEVVHSVDDALRFFAAPESLEGYKPSTGKAGEVVSASKSVKIQTLPRVLILHLMRFSYGSEGSSKLHKPVQFPLELTLGRELLASTTNSGNEIRKYELVATLSHHGKDPSVGHYTADSKQASGQWLHFDDGVVSGVGVSRVLREQAYVLFYKRAGF